MKVIPSVEEMQATALRLRAEGRRVALVPTMGYLHEGHLSLLRLARPLADVLVVSIFVNPTQFGPGEDLDGYPRDFDRDCRLCEASGADLVFHPAPEDMYRPGGTVRIVEDSLSKALCGRSRPSHFDGVLTVVSKLFNIARPHVAVFGQKDAQQVCLIRRMVTDLNFPVEIVTGPIVREPDGLAMSSRNAYLSPEERVDAVCLHRALSEAAEHFAAGERDVSRLKSGMEATVATAQTGTVDYVEIVDLRSLQPVEGQLHDPALAAVAVRFGRARLIDNVVLAAADETQDTG